MKEALFCFMRLQPSIFCFCRFSWISKDIKSNSSENPTILCVCLIYRTSYHAAIDLRIDLRTDVKARKKI
jgi:hypothetical protein